MKSAPFLILAIAITGCSTQEFTREDPKTGSPTGALLRGDLTSEEYLKAIADANAANRSEELFLLNKEPTRAYNTKTQKIEYLPEGTSQKWNEAKQRWEFTPID